MTIRRANVADVPAMGRLINDCAELGLMLPKSQSALYEGILAFQVAEEDEGLGSESDPAAIHHLRSAIVGVCGLSVVWANLAEIASLAVDPSRRGKGIGRQLVEVCLQQARELGIRKVMTLTYEQAFFERCGFRVVDRMNLPLKVWSQCVQCPKNQACDEIAMVIELEDVAEVHTETPPAKALDYEVPVLLTTKGKTPGSGT